jgi:hypothetical protein
MSLYISGHEIAVAPARPRSERELKDTGNSPVCQLCDPIDKIPPRVGHNCCIQTKCPKSETCRVSIFSPHPLDCSDSENVGPGDER